MPRSKAKCYLLDLGLLKLLCRRDNVDILYDSSNGSNRRNFVNSFVEELRASLAQNAKFAVDNEHDPIGRFPTAFEHLVLLYVYLSTYLHSYRNAPFSKTFLVPVINQKCFY